MMNRIAPALIAAGLALFPLAGIVAAQEPVMTVDWSVSRPATGEVVEGNVHLSAGDAGAQLPLIAIDVPDLGRAGYAIRGRVRYADIAGSGYLEMWSVFPDGGRYFSRTLGTSGPMGVLTGSSDWREFELPFYLEGSTPPARLEINVFLPSSGSVDVSPLELVRLPGAAAGTNAWLSDRSVGVIGAVLGSAIGLLGALIGVLVSRQRGRRFVLPAMTAAVAIGIALVVTSVLAIPAGQPPNVVFLLFLPGAILAGAFGAAIPRVRRVYAEAELRRIRAMDHA